MTAKQFVKNIYPNARAERQVSGMVKGMQEVYWLIRDGRATMYMAMGKTESNAWVKAKENIIKNQNTKIYVL